MWKMGQKLICIKDSPQEPVTFQIKKGLQYTYVKHHEPGWVIIKEAGFSVAYKEICFRPVDDRRDADTDELIRQFTVPETLDAPFVPKIKKPQTA